MQENPAASFHVHRPTIRLDQCFPGLQDASSNHSLLLSPWLQAARELAPQCYVKAETQPQIFASLVSHKHRFVYQINAKVCLRGLSLFALHS